MASITSTPQNSKKLFGAYVLLLIGGIVAFLLIREAGQHLAAPDAVSLEASDAPGPGSVIASVPKQAEVNVVFHVLLTLAAIITLGQLLAGLFHRIGQPAVIGEVVAGILLGPSLLGAISPDAMHWLIPGADADPQKLVLSALKMVAELGVVLYMFIVGLELNTHKVGRQAHAAIAISHASIIVPFVLGAGLALWLYPLLSNSDVTFTSFALFLGVAMSITAFPVLARILTDQKLEQTDIGVIALSCAASDDVTAWCLLAFIVGAAQAKIGGAIMIAVWTVAFIAAMFLIARPLLLKWVTWLEPRGLDRRATPILFVAVLCSALITHAIGIHAVFGAFLFGAVIPHDSRVAQELSRRLHDVVTILLLPAFFSITGMNTRIGLISGLDSWLICGVIILIATLGKCGGTVAAARFVGVDWRTSTALGILMNTRGLMELIVLNIGLQMGVISDKLFAMMVIMALVTTMATAPILQTLIPDFRRSAAPGTDAAVPTPAA